MKKWGVSNNKLFFLFCKIIHFSCFVFLGKVRREVNGRGQTRLAQARHIGRWAAVGGSPVNDQKPDQFDRFRKNLVVSEIQKSGNTGDLTLIKSFPINFFAINKFVFFPCKPHYFKDYLACSSLCFYVVIIKVALQLMIILTLIVHQFVFLDFRGSRRNLSL